MIKIAIIGAGNMGQALLAGALRAGFTASDITVTTMDEAARTEIAQGFGVEVAVNNKDAVAGAKLVLIAVKPKDVSQVLQEITPNLAADTVILSVAVGLSVDTLAACLPIAQPIIRAMPNTPAGVGAGITAISAGPNVTSADMALAQRFLAGSGAVVTVPESEQSAVGAISGSGPAYVAYFIEALIEAGVRQGLNRQAATLLAVETFRGTALMLSQSLEHPSLARERVTSPGGTTAAALHVLDAGAVRATISDAVQAAMDKTAEIAKQQH